LLTLVDAKGACDAKWTQAEAQRYLNQPRAVQNMSCTADAVSLIAGSEFPDPLILVNYLAVARPALSGMILLTQDNVSDLYPAFNPVVGAGLRIETKLLTILADTSNEFALRRNAARALWAIHNRDTKEAVTVLERAAWKEGTERRRNALLEAGYWVREWTDASVSDERK
jgi:hypothetical protein